MRRNFDGNVPTPCRKRHPHSISTQKNEASARLDSPSRSEWYLVRISGTILGVQREIGFYMLVPGFSTYLGLVSIWTYALILNPKPTIKTDDWVFYVFLFIFLYGISLVLVVAGNQAQKLLKLRWLIPLSIVPFIMILGWRLAMQ
ncbi:hypothetical protein EBR57_02880 [bacterium]|nr:hypothetical protein [bacterium]